ncbi:MAG: hypothetical protein ACI4PO_06510 [Faecousia sp.]
MKKFLAILLSLVLCVSVFAGCANTNPDDTQGSGATTEPTTSSTPSEEVTEPSTEPVSEDPIEALPGSIYYFGYAVEGLGNMIQFYHFYPDDLGIGAVFYAGYAWNQITFSGTYTVAEEPCDYAVMTEKGGDTVSGTAPYTITLYDWDGAELDKLAYDGEHVYNIAVNTNCDPMTGGGTFLLDKADAEVIAANPDTFEGEKGIAYMNFVCPDDASATLQLNTNGTYSDLTVFAVDGKWAKTGDDEYTLTPDDSSDDGAVVTKQEDGSYLYVSSSGTEVVLNLVKEAAPAYVFAGKTPFMDAEADVTITAYDDGTCVAVMAAFGMEMPIDAGTWTESGFTFTFTFDGAGEIVSEFGGATGVQVTYVCESVAAIGGGSVNAVCGVVLE